MGFFDSPNLALLVIILGFWSIAILVARAYRVRMPLNLLSLPVFFLIVGISVNQYRHGWGTYAVALIHVMMLPALLRVARARK